MITKKNMIKAKLRQLAYVLVETVGDRKIKSLEYTSLNKMTGEYFNKEGKILPLLVEYFPRFKSLKSSTSSYRMDVASVERLEEIQRDHVTYKELSKNVLTKKALYDKLKIGKMKFDLKGHYTGYNGTNEPMINHFTEKYLRQYEREKDGANGGMDGKWTERDGRTMEEINVSMRKYYALKLKWPFTKNQRIDDSWDDRACSACGKEFEIVVKDKDTLTVYPGYHMLEEGDVITQCKYPKGPPHSHGEIQVNETLIFANFFISMKADCPEKEQYGRKYDLCTFAGRKNITQWKTENQNVAYGQMGNMGLSVWYNKKENRIFLTECYMEEEPKKITWLRKQGFKQIGDSISLSVWRWEATDVDTLLKTTEQSLEEIKKEYKDDYKDLVIVPVKSGTWEFIHYYDTTPDPDSETEPFIYAELKLKN